MREAIAFHLEGLAEDQRPLPEGDAWQLHRNLLCRVENCSTRSLYITYCLPTEPSHSSRPACEGLTGSQAEY